MLFHQNSFLLRRTLLTAFGFVVLLMAPMKLIDLSYAKVPNVGMFSNTTSEFINIPRRRKVSKHRENTGLTVVDEVLQNYDFLLSSLSLLLVVGSVCGGTGWGLR